jgi:hypothetical protein
VKSFTGKNDFGSERRDTRKQQENFIPWQVQRPRPPRPPPFCLFSCTNPVDCSRGPSHLVGVDTFVPMLVERRRCCDSRTERYFCTWRWDQRQSFQVHLESPNHRCNSANVSRGVRAKSSSWISFGSLRNNFMSASMYRCICM